MLFDRNNAPLSTANMVRLIATETRHALQTLPQTHRRQAALRSNVVNGHFDGNGNFQKYWTSDDAVDAFPIAPN